MADAPQIPDEATVRAEWGGFQWTPENAAQAEKVIARYPAGRQRSAVMPLLDLAQRQVGAETNTQGWLPMPVMEYVAAISTCLYPRGRGGDLLHHVQPRAGRPLPCAGLRHHAVHAARVGRCVGRLQAKRPAQGPHHRWAVHADRGRVHGQLRQRADGADQRRQLRRPDRRNDDRDPRRSRRGQKPQDRHAGAGPAHGRACPGGRAYVAQGNGTRTASSPTSTASRTGAWTRRRSAATGTTPRSCSKSGRTDHREIKASGLRGRGGAGFPTG
jgi:hypothetical protein